MPLETCQACGESWSQLEIHVCRASVGRKDAKPEDYSLIPPEPLARLIEMLIVYEHDAGGPPWINITLNAFSSFIAGEVDRGALLDAASAVCDGVGHKKLLDSLARVYVFGAEQKGAMNWRLGYKWSLSAAAAYRHLLAHIDGEDFDRKSKELHLASFVWHCFTLYEFDRLSLGEDDVRSRWKEPRRMLGLEARIAPLILTPEEQEQLRCHGRVQITPPPRTMGEIHGSEQHIPRELFCEKCGNLDITKFDAQKVYALTEKRAYNKFLDTLCHCSEDHDAR